ncbi:hemagglutinin-like protein [Leifsonia xyli subsp. cynodontis DSM 46306]|uniref:Hemagglutinin-related protein n=1 Tax=Leifsonia xyli subsp. cynodontis DSM 46306 TaxID=1389489 RepID=U3PB24_LEIXC|nr:hypothetical protein [Leifsonia xyli]AGW40713.1 hemagglutinin-like protein [Leifsonia xyli subsp. cynodontis DSM 46306]
MMRSTSIVTVLIGALVGGLLTVAPVAMVAPAPATAADARLFDPGNIISDALFFDGDSMTADQVQSFLNGKVTSCRSGYTCLKDYAQQTQTRAAVDGRCAAYTSQGTESAATIIAKVGEACGVSQRAILVLLEKEQSLVTDTWPGAGQYRSATGYGCPDTAGCDTRYYGFFNQVYNAALQFKRYAASPTSWNHIAGRVNQIRFSPTASCGSGSVFIQNQATAGLYNYTPYQPNAAALANLYGTGDSCSSYGNRNFWRLYTDWFGSTTGASSLARTVDNGTVYVLSGTVKYPIASIDLLTALSPLGSVGYVSQQYLDGYRTGPIAGRILRGNDGSVYFFDSGLKLPFGSCGLVADYGGSCSATGYMQLTDAQLARFTTGPLMTPALGTTSGSRYFVTVGTKREILDDASQQAAGIPLARNVLTESAVAALPLGAPVIADQSFAQQRGSASVAFVSSGRSYSVDAASLGQSGVAGRVGGTLSAASLARVPASGVSFTGLVSVPGSGSTSVLGSGGRFVWAGGGGVASASATPVTQAFLDSFPVKGTVSVGSFVKGDGATVYIVGPSDLKPISSWGSLLALLPPGATPTIMTMPTAALAALPAGRVALTSGTLVRSPENATVYLVNGLSNKIAFSTFDVTASIGVDGLSFVSQSVLDGYPVAGSLLGYGVTCRGVDYVGASGTLRALDATTKPLYPVSFTALDDYTCARLTVGAPATKFIRTPDGSIFLLEGGKKRPIANMNRFAELGGAVGWTSVSAGFGASIPTGPLA